MTTDKPLGEALADYLRRRAAAAKVVMSFLSPAFLWGCRWLAVPVLIHFFSRKQRTPIRWGAMEFLLASATPRRRFLRLRDLLLLLLRIAIVLALVGALAQPMLSLELDRRHRAARRHFDC